ncbi:MAG: hypothetical protein V3T70_11430 [Phycisphaerae bacterium]
MQEFFAYMSDNAMQADMSLKEMHFVPHQTFLSGTGEARLERMAELLAECGGVIHYQASRGDDEFVQNRLESVRQFLAEQNVQDTSIEVAVGPGGAGQLEARYGILVHAQGLIGYGIRQEPAARLEISNTGAGGAGAATGGARQ